MEAGKSKGLGFRCAVNSVGVIVGSEFRVWGKKGCQRSGEKRFGRRKCPSHLLLCREITWTEVRCGLIETNDNDFM